MTSTGSRTERLEPSISNRRRHVITSRIGVLLLALGLLLAAAAPAAAAPVWNLDIHHNETNFTPGGTAEYWFETANIGSTESAGLVTLTVHLGDGVSLESVRERGNGGENPRPAWTCIGSSTVTCTTSTPFPLHTVLRNLILGVAIAPAASGKVFTSATLKGGGALSAYRAVDVAAVGADPKPFGIVEDTFLADFFEPDGKTLVRQSGAHPSLAKFSFDLTSVASPRSELLTQKAPSGNIRDLQIDLPPGFVGNPSAVEECSPEQLSGAGGGCPKSSQVGRADLILYPSTMGAFDTTTAAVFNMSHPRGVITDLAFIVAGNAVHVKAFLDASRHYAVSTTVENANESLPPFSSNVTIWGVPGDAEHDSERCGSPADTSKSCSTSGPVRAFLTTPFECGKENQMHLKRYNSWQQPGVYGPDVSYTMPGLVKGCDNARFEPDVKVTPTGLQANTPTGLDVRIQIPQNENAYSRATPPVKSTAVTLPQGMSFSPSFTDGLQACSLAQIKLGTSEAVECPDASRIGEVTISTPVLPQPLEGSMYLGKQGDNPFGSLFAVYLALHDTEERGVLLKLPGRIDVDESSGQITTVFDETPQLPFDELALKFRSGPRAPLINPPTCGKKTIGVKIATWAEPDSPVDVSNTYTVSEGPSGASCSGDEASLPFSPKFSGGTLNPVAGSYSTFLFRLSRDDREQEFSRVTTILPKGLLAKVAGIPFCSEAAIASISSELGTGENERQHPACPSASQIGTVSAGLGSGPGPNYFGGSVYLAGPYSGAPLSLAVVIPGIAGPFDLGNTVVRVAVHVDPETSQVTAVSDPFPRILHGVILRVRDVRLRLDRPETTINPTSCEPTLLGGQIFGGSGAVFDTGERFQVGECARLGFKPRLALSLTGGTDRGDNPALRAVLRPRPGDANATRISVTLPHTEFLDQRHINTVCTRAQFKAGAGNGSECPLGAIYGRARAFTPLFSEPLEGPIFLRSSSNPLPDLVLALDGIVDVTAVGRIDSVNARIRNTFDFVPDAPVSKVILNFRGGYKSLLRNSDNLCRATHAATVKAKGHNGKVSNFATPLKAKCGAKKARAGHKSSARSDG
jgi:hypothetical protein